MCGGRCPLYIIHGGITTMWVEPLQVFNQHFDRYNDSAALIRKVHQKHTDKTPSAQHLRHHSTRRDRCYVIWIIYLPFSIYWWWWMGFSTICDAPNHHQYYNIVIIWSNKFYQTICKYNSRKYHFILLSYILCPVRERYVYTWYMERTAMSKTCPMHK